MNIEIVEIGLGHGMERDEIETLFRRDVAFSVQPGWQRWIVGSGHRVTDVVHEKNGCRFVKRWHGIRASAVGVNNEIEVVHADVRPL